MANLFEHYEAWGEVAVRLLAQEERFEEIHRRKVAAVAAYARRRPEAGDSSGDGRPIGGTGAEAQGVVGGILMVSGALSTP